MDDDLYKVVLFTGSQARHIRTLSRRHTDRAPTRGATMMMNETMHGGGGLLGHGDHLDPCPLACWLSALPLLIKYLRS